MSIHMFMVIFLVGCVNANLFGQDIFQTVSDRIRQSFHFPIFKPFVIPAPHIPHIPTPEEIANKKPGPGENYSGISVSSHSSSSSNNGKTQGTNSGTVIMNNNGEVKKFQFGDPQPERQNKNPFPKFEIPLPKIPIWRPFNFVNPVNIRTYNPDNGNFQQSSVVYVGGNGGGIANIVQNINGKITHEVIDLNPDN